MKLQNLTVIFIIIILPVILVLSAYMGYEMQTIKKQNMYNNGLVAATHDAIFAFELNTKNDVYYNNAENKRSNIKAAVKTFENSLSTACNLGLYNNQAIEEYIPAIVFGLYDGFYMYAPTQTQGQGYKHELRNYVYYSEEIKEGNIDIIIRYTLDNYVAVSGTIDGTYITKAGYLINLNQCNGYSYNPPQYSDGKLGEATLNDTFTYYGATIKKDEQLRTYTYDQNEKKVVLVNALNGEYEIDNSAINYFKESIAISTWVNKYKKRKLGENFQYLKINNNNDPEDENSPFVQHKREIMKEKIESILNSSITAYANKTRNKYKMPKFSGEDWNKIYNNISVISFVQGMNLGFKDYNNYCILNSTNNQEYVNPNLIYFSDGNNYHDIRCNDIKDTETTGYKIGDFEKIKYDITNEKGEVTGSDYYYKHNELACYKCINGSLENDTNIYNYARANDTKTKVKISYFTSLARERYKTTKLLSAYNQLDKIEVILTFDPNTTDKVENMPKPPKRTVYKNEPIDLSDLSEPTREGYAFVGWSNDEKATTGTTKFENYSIKENTTLYAIWAKQCTVTFDTQGGNSIQNQLVTKGNKVQQPEDPTRWGYNFVGWYSDRECTHIYNFNTSIENDITLYAKWKKNSIIVRYFHDNGIFEKEVTNTGSYTVEDIEKANKTGYILVGWRYNGTTYAKGSSITYDAGNTEEIELQANYIQDFEITIVAKDENGNELENYSEFKNNEKNKEFFKYTPIIGKPYYNIPEEECDNNIYTNVERVKVEAKIKTNIKTEDKNRIQFKYFYSDKEGNQISEEGSYNVKAIPVVDGIELQNKVTEQTIIIDRKAPIITKIWCKKQILDLYTISLIIEDAGEAGLANKSLLRIKYANNYDLEKDESYNQYNAAATSNDIQSGIITICDKAGNYRQYKYENLDKNKSLNEKTPINFEEYYK